VKLTLLFCVKYYLEILIILQKRRRLAFFGCSLEVLSLLLSALLCVFFHSCQLYFDKRRKTNESKLLFRMNGVESKKSSEIFITETFIQICESNVIKIRNYKCMCCKKFFFRFNKFTFCKGKKTFRLSIKYFEIFLFKSDLKEIFIYL
jgi:hypothetical protein